MQVILHTGDMRWQPRLAEHPALKANKIDILYMDTTYCLPKHVFPSQVSRLQPSVQTTPDYVHSTVSLRSAQHSAK